MLSLDMRICVYLLQQYIQLTMSERKYTFIVEWFDPSASIVKQFYFTFFMPAQQIEMYDIKNHKIFLKKIQYPQIKLQDLYIGNVVNCYNRQLKIVAFGDEFTRKQLVGQETSNRTYGMLKPNAYMNFGKMIAATEKQFNIANLKMFQFDQQAAGKFYGQHEGKSFYPTLINFMTSDYSVGMQLVAPNAITKWRTFIGPTNSLKAKQEAPGSLRALYGEDGTKNACHGSDSPQSVERQLGLIFSSQAVVSPKAHCENCTLCIIKPHAVKNKNVGQIVDVILSAGFEISAMQMVLFDHTVSQQFYEAYKFLPEQKKLIDHLASGPSIAIEVRQDNAVEKFRKLCGPYDPDIARKLEPTSLRACFGTDRVMNGVHCTDLPEDGRLQVEFVFRTLLG